MIFSGVEEFDKDTFIRQFEGNSDLQNLLDPSGLRKFFHRCYKQTPLSVMNAEAIKESRAKGLYTENDMNASVKRTQNKRKRTNINSK